MGAESTLSSPPLSPTSIRVSLFVSSSLHPDHNSAIRFIISHSGGDTLVFVLLRCVFGSTRCLLFATFSSGVPL